MTAAGVPPTDAHYWSDVGLADATSPAVAAGAGTQPYQPSSRTFPSGFGPVPGAEPSNFIENADGSTSATISVPNDVSLPFIFINRLKNKYSFHILTCSYSCLIKT